MSNSKTPSADALEILRDIRSVYAKWLTDHEAAALIDSFAAKAVEAARPALQPRVLEWCVACFGEEITRDVTERNHRFLEEALELVQSLGCTRSEAHQLVDYTFDRPVGEPSQELGGVMITLAALANASSLNMDECAETELSRIRTKVDAIRAKQAAKPKHSPLPQHVDARPALPEDVTELCMRLRTRFDNDGHLKREAADALEAQAAEIARLTDAIATLRELRGYDEKLIASQKYELSRRDEQNKQINAVHDEFAASLGAKDLGEVAKRLLDAEAEIARLTEALRIAEEALRNVSSRAIINGSDGVLVGVDNYDLKEARSALETIRKARG